jgi:hypothetical protein
MLLSLPLFKSELGISSTDRDARLTQLVSAAAQAVKDYLGWDPETADFATGHTEYLGPNGGDSVSVRDVGCNVPVTVSAVYLDDSREFASDTLLELDTDYMQAKAGSTAIVRLGCNWPYEVRRAPDRLAGTIGADTGTLKVVYTADTTAALSAAQEAALMEALARYNLGTGGRGVGLVTSASMDGASITINTDVISRKKEGAADFISPVVAGMLKNYRKLLIA